jgi:adenylyltransferase/sulfurtransferase
MAIPEITASELHQRLNDDDSIVLLDVREQHEYDYARIENAVLVPMSSVQQLGPAAMPEAISADSAIVVYCHHGVRSFHVGCFLAENGYTDVTNLAGGINAWSLEVDWAVPRY